MSNSNQATETKSSIVITPEALLEHWQGHRKLTRKMIAVFPEDKLFSYSVGGMRPFSELVLEMLGMAVPGVKGVITGNWQKLNELPAHLKKAAPTTKTELLDRWDEATEALNVLWPQIPPHRFLETDTAFGQWEGPGYFFIFYWIDNEIHHRGQAYVYLRSLNIEPPAFWDRY
ncbi:DinB family protein [Agriterribacter sp.]|uniref:DinB family protein n=1 Tax=Agriterribacter sp. TaxID=2821509 RepID=UPI002D12D86E|nr:DinB family protein [Agriterribacter sp.]HTN05309.1 DinB family protein [Agriterribacter sp.]